MVQPPAKYFTATSGSLMGPTPKELDSWTLSGVPTKTLYMSGFHVSIYSAVYSRNPSKLSKKRWLVGALQVGSCCFWILLLLSLG